MKLRKALLAFMILLALIGIPVLPPKKLEIDVDDKIKTEVQDENSEKD